VETAHEDDGVSILYTPTMMVRERAVWLTNHLGATVEDCDRVLWIRY
jgi:hypothetical protein